MKKDLSILLLTIIIINFVIVSESHLQTYNCEISYPGNDNFEVFTEDGDIFIEDHMGLRARDCEGHWRYLTPISGIPLVTSLDGKLKDFYAYHGTESVLHFGRKFGLDLRSLKNKEIQWTSFNSRGIAILYDDSSLFSYQIIPLSKKKYAASQVDAHLYTFGEDENHLLCLHKKKPILYAVDNREALPLVGMDQQTIDKLKGVTVVIASMFSAKNITRVESADFYFSNPLYPEFNVNIAAKSKDKKKVPIIFTSASKSLNEILDKTK